MRRSIPLVALLLACPLAAQEVRVTPRDGAARGDLLRPATVTYRWLMVRDGAEHPVGTLTDALSRTERDGVAALLRVVSVQRPGAVLVDSTLSRTSDLAPLAHRSHQPHRSIDLRFHGQQVRGTVTPVQGEAQAIDTAYDLPFFDSGNWDLVLRALPLAAGRRVSISVFDQDNGGQIWYEAEVTELVDGAWRVEARLNRTTATLWIDAETRALRRLEMQAGPGMVLRQVPAE